MIHPLIVIVFISKKGGLFIGKGDDFKSGRK